MSWLPDLVLDQLGAAVAGLLTSFLTDTSSSTSTAAANSFSRIGSLLAALPAAADQDGVTQRVAGPVAAALVGPVQQGDAPPEAASLLAKVVKQFGAGVMTAAPAAALPGGGRTTGTACCLTCFTLIECVHHLSFVMLRWWLSHVLDCLS